MLLEWYLRVLELRLLNPDENFIVEVDFSSNINIHLQEFLLFLVLWFQLPHVSLRKTSKVSASLINPHLGHFNTVLPDFCSLCFLPALLKSMPLKLGTMAIIPSHIFPTSLHA